MKRLITSFILLLLCFIVCIYGYYKINSSCKNLINELFEAYDLIQSNQDNKAVIEKLENCHALWDKMNTPFGIFLKHDFFSPVENTVPILKESFASDKKLCNQKILEAIATLENIVDQQRVSIGNIL